MAEVGEIICGLDIGTTKVSAVVGMALGHNPYFVLAGSASTGVILGFQVKELLGGIEYWQREGYAVEGTDVADDETPHVDPTVGL